MIMHQLGERVNRILQELTERVARTVLPVQNIEMAKRGEPFAPFVNGAYWGKEGGWFDFRFTARVPETFGARAVLRVKTGREGQWDATNPQFVVRANGKIAQAFDTNHTALPLESGKTYDILLNGYTPETPALVAAPIFYLTLEDVNEGLYQLITDLEMPLEAARLLEAGDREREVTLETLARAVDMLDLRAYHSPAFDEGVAAARRYMKENYYDKRANLPAEAVAECVGHTHIDVAWLWDLYQTRSKAVRSFSTVLSLMDRYPEYKFMSSQPVLYQFVKEDEPELFERIRAAVERGQWEPEGGMWVEADCNLAGGESLARQFLHGQAFFEREFKKRSRILWLPDVFGYAAALPQLMKLSGVDYFMTTKISWSEFNLAPYDTFLWKGVDGTEVLTHFSPARDDYTTSREEAHFTTYNAFINPSQMRGGWKRFQQKDVDDHILVSFGYGDGGGGPTEQMLENARRMENPLPGVPAVRMGHARPFFEALEERVKDDPRLPKWSGELYLEYHRGTYTGMARNKRSNRKMEIALREAELFCLAAKAYPKAQLYKIWEDALTLQFHDILPGSSIEKVYIDSKEIYERRFAELYGILDLAKAKLAGAGKGITLFNSLSHARSDLAVFACPEGATALVDSEGARHPIQRVSDGEGAAFVENLPAMGGKGFAFAFDNTDDSALNVTREGFDTPFFTGSFDKAGRISSLVVKANGRELAREPLNRIVCYENKPHAHDAWDINIYVSRRHWDVDDLESAALIENGPVRAVVRHVYRYMNSTVTQDVIFYRDVPRVDFVTRADWREKQYLLKAHFPMDVFYNEATYDIQYGNVKRSTTKNTSWDVARFEVCAHKWADVSEDGFGASLLNDCKYGYSCDENSLALTLLKSSVYPNPVADQEEHQFTYSLYPHVGGWREANAPDMAYRLNIPVTSAAGGADVPALCSVDAPNVIVESVKAPENGEGMIVRLYECFGRRTNARLTLGTHADRAKIVNILEDELADARIKDGAIDMTLRPYEIRTYRIGG